MSQAFIAFLHDQLDGLEGLNSRRMFGGHCLRAADTTFALLIRDTLYFCVDDLSRPRYQAMGSQGFSYEKASKRIAIERYYAVPAEQIEDADALLSLAREAIAAARRSPSSTRRKARPSAKTRR